MEEFGLRLCHVYVMHFGVSGLLLLLTLMLLQVGGGQRQHGKQGLFPRSTLHAVQAPAHRGGAGVPGHLCHLAERALLLYPGLHCCHQRDLPFEDPAWQEGGEAGEAAACMQVPPLHGRTGPDRHAIPGPVMMTHTDPFCHTHSPPQ